MAAVAAAAGDVPKGSTSDLPCRFGRDGTVRLKQQWKQGAGRDDDGLHREGIGLFLWGAATVLARHLEVDDAWPKGSLAGKRVVELGAGTGYCGIVAHKAGAADVVLTDTGDHLELLRANIALNVERRNGDGADDAAAVAEADGERARTADGRSMSASELWWGDDDAARALGPVDLVLASDVVYDPSCFKVLVQTLSLLLRSAPGAQALVAFQYRQAKELEFFELATDAGLVYHKVPAALMHPEATGGSDIGCFRLTATEPSDWVA